MHEALLLLCVGLGGVAVGIGDEAPAHHLGESVTRAKLSTEPRRR
jgi:hypothetical protein